MGKKNNRTCLICRQNYHFCPTCGEDSGKPSWYALFHDQNCHDIYDVCVGYRDKVITTDEAYNKLAKLDLSALEDFNEVTKGQIKEILASHKETPIAEEKKPTVNNDKVAPTNATKFKKK